MRKGSQTSEDTDQYAQNEKADQCLPHEELKAHKSLINMGSFLIRLQGCTGWSELKIS